MSIPLYPRGTKRSFVQSPEGVIPRDARRIRWGRMETDRDMLWKTIVSRLDGNLITESLYFKLQQARAEALADQLMKKELGKESVTGERDSAVPRPRRSSVSHEGSSRTSEIKKIDWWCGGWCKKKPKPSDPGFAVVPKELMQPDVPPTKLEKWVGLLLGVLASVLLGISIGIVQLLTYGYKNSVEMVLFYQFGGMLLTSLPPFMFYKFVSSRRVAIWGRLIGDDQYINYKRGVMCSVRALFGMLGLISEYHAMQYMVPGDASLIVFTAPIIGAFGAMIFKKRPKEPILILLAILLVPTGFTFLVWAEYTGGAFVHYPTHRTSGFGLALLGTVTIALNQYILRFLRYVHWSITQFVYGFSGFVIISIVVMFSIGTEFTIPLGGEIWWFLGLLLCSCTGEILWQIAHKYQAIATLGAVRFLVETTVLYVIEFYVFGWTPHLYVGVGGGVLTLAVLLWALKEAW